MPVIQLTITIEVENYQEIVTKKRGEFLGFLAGVPIVKWPITSHVDSLIAEEVKLALIAQIGDKVEQKLAMRGIRARVEVT